MVRFSRSQVLPIGLDLGLDAVKMLQLEVVDNSLKVVAAVKQAMPAETRNQPDLRLPAAMDIVRQLLRSGEFSGRGIVTTLPREMVQVKNLRLPVMPPTELEAAVNFEARNIFSFDTDDAVVRYLPTGEVRQGTDTKLEVIALAAQPQQVDNFIEQLHRSGSIVESLDFEPCALYRGIERFIRRREDESDVHVLVDLGARQTQVLIGKGRDISFYKPIEIGSKRLHEDVARKLGITEDEARGLRRRQIETSASNAAGSVDPVRQAVSDATRSTIEELAREIALCLRYYSVTFRGHRPGKVRLVGGEAGDPQLLSILGAALPIPVETGRPLLSVNTDAMKAQERRGYLSEWAVALGLGLKMTKNYFGSRDGKRRSTAKPTGGLESEVETIDFGQALESAPSLVTRGTGEAANA